MTRIESSVVETPVQMLIGGVHDCVSGELVGVGGVVFLDEHHVVNEIINSLELLGRRLDLIVENRSKLVFANVLGIWKLDVNQDLKMNIS